MKDLLDDDDNDTGPTDPLDWPSGIAHHAPSDDVVDDVLKLMRSREAQAKAVHEINEAINDNIRKALQKDPRNAKRMLESTDILAHVDPSTKKQLEVFQKNGADAPTTWLEWTLALGNRVNIVTRIIRAFFEVFVCAFLTCVLGTRFRKWGPLSTIRFLLTFGFLVLYQFVMKYPDVAMHFNNSHTFHRVLGYFERFPLANYVVRLIRWGLQQVSLSTMALTVLHSFFCHGGPSPVYSVLMWRLSPNLSDLTNRFSKFLAPLIGPVQHAMTLNKTEILNSKQFKHLKMGGLSMTSIALHSIMSILCGRNPMRQYEKPCKAATILLQIPGVNLAIQYSLEVIHVFYDALVSNSGERRKVLITRACQLVSPDSFPVSDMGHVRTLQDMKAQPGKSAERVREESIAQYAAKHKVDLSGGLSPDLLREYVGLDQSKVFEGMVYRAFQRSSSTSSKRDGGGEAARPRLQGFHETL